MIDLRLLAIIAVATWAIPVGAENRPNISLTLNRPAPHQIDLAEDPAHAGKLAALEALLWAEQKRLDDPYPLWAQPE